MTRPSTAVRECVELAAEGHAALQISRLTGIPRSTVRDWLAGDAPRRILGPRPGGCPRCGGRAHRYSELPDDYAYLLGVYLGDGCLSLHPRGVYKLRLALDAAYPGIAVEAAFAVSAVMSTSRVNRRLTLSNNFEVYSYSKAWPCLLPQHGPGRKHLRPIELERWQDDVVKRVPHLLLRGLIHSDGCRFMNTGRRWRHPRYVFCNFSSDIRRIFCDACDQMDLHWTSSKKVIYVSRKRDVAILDHFIGPKA